MPTDLTGVRPAHAGRDGGPRRLLGARAGGSRRRLQVAAGPRLSRRETGIPALPHTWIRIAVADDPTLRYGADLLVASWRDLGLRVRIADRNADARFVRVAPLPKGAIPIARAVDARLVSPRVRGWREDARGVVDYARVKLR